MCTCAHALHTIPSNRRRDSYPSEQRATRARSQSKNGAQGRKDGRRPEYAQLLRLGSIPACAELIRPGINSRIGRFAFSLKTDYLMQTYHVLTTSLLKLVDLGHGLVLYLSRLPLSYRNLTLRPGPPVVIPFL